MVSDTAKLLLVDDDRDLCEMLTEYLSGEGFNCTALHEGGAAVDALSRGNPYDAVVLDVMMPDLSGLEVLQRIRLHDPGTAIVMLTGRGDDIDRILGLEMGADDYLAKPCNPRELAARLRAVLRRRQAKPVVGEARPVHLHGIELNSRTLSATAKGQTLNLTSAEFNALQLLMLSAGDTLSKQHLTETVLHRPLEQYDRAIDVHVSRIRQKLASAGVQDVIKAVRGLGYQMVAQRERED